MLTSLWFHLQARQVGTRPFLGPRRESSAPSIDPRRLVVQWEIGSGAMGVVFLAVDPQSGRRLAVKVPRRDYVDGAGRLAHEAWVGRQARDLGLVEVHGYSEAGARSRLALEYLPGGTLSERLFRRPLTCDEAIALGAAIASGLDSLHAAGIVHCDVKPSNIGFAADGTAKLFDFGIATPVGQRALKSAGRCPMKAPSGRVLSHPGTGAYLSPEAARGALPTPADDLWSLGVVLFEALTASNLHFAPTPQAMVEQAACGVPPDFSRRLAAVPPSFVGFLRRALATSPADRPTSGRAIAAELLALRRQLPAAA